MDKKRFFAVLSVLMILSFVLTACGGATPTAAPEAATESSQPEAEPEATEAPAEAEAEPAGEEAAPAEEPVTIRFQDWRLAEEPAATALKYLITEFEASHPNIKVALEPVSNAERVDKFNNQFRAGDPPDVVRFNLTEIPTEVAMGALLPLDSYIEQAGGDEFLGDFTQYMTDVATVDGQVYAIPHEGDAFVLFLNKGMWEAAGLDPVNNPPSDMEALKAANLALTDAAANQYAFGMWPGWQWMQTWFTAYGADYFNTDYSDTLIDTPEGIAAFTYYTDLVTTDKVVPPGVTEVDYGGQVALMAQEQVAYIEGPYATYGGILAANPELDGNLVVIPIPGKTIGRGTHFAIGNGSQHPDEAWQLIEFLSQPENQLKFFVEGSMMPTRQSALAMIDFDKYPAAKVMVEQAIPNAISYYPAFPAWNKCSTVIQDALTSTLLGETEPEAAMKDAATQIRAILAEESE
ncbi:MAG: ABC transporter substrate-binding protein [Chloroflexi bacterium]|nr:ABC transporter substrate-binding protein [Anaerolineaceae bacterium]NMB90731.1 ABC transporter substrate-binding protein [Chloroflexota bacterium]